MPIFLDPPRVLSRRGGERLRATRVVRRRRSRSLMGLLTSERADGEEEIEGNEASSGGTRRGNRMNVETESSVHTCSSDDFCTSGNGLLSVMLQG